MGEVKPLVSCVMPTANRREFIPRALRSFIEQDYENRELVILDSGSDPVFDLVCDLEKPKRTWSDRFIVYSSLDHWKEPDTMTLGGIRNMVNALATPAPLIMHWDDDDWYRSNRISEQVDTLLSGDYDIVGLSRHLFHKPETDETWLYTYPESQQPWLAGGTCLYKRSLWERFPFPDVQVGSDTQWMWSWPVTRLATPDGYRGQGFGSNMPEIVDGQRVKRDYTPVKMCAMLDYGFYVATIHEGNTSKKIIQENEWKPWGGDIHALMSDKARVQIV